MGEEQIEVRAERLLSELESATEPERDARRDEARELAELTKRAGVDLCHSRATEQSPRIGELFLLAAKLAFVGYDDETRPEHFEEDIQLDPVARAEYARYVAACTPEPEG